jgi:hypothetical protein
MLEWPKDLKLSCMCVALWVSAAQQQSISNAVPNHALAFFSPLRTTELSNAEAKIHSVAVTYGASIFQLRLYNVQGVQCVTLLKWRELVIQKRAK